MSINTGGIDLLKNNFDKIDYWNLSLNTKIFEIDYYKIKESIAPIKEDLIAAVFHWKRVERILNQYQYLIGVGDFI